MLGRAAQAGAHRLKDPVMIGGRDFRSRLELIFATQARQSKVAAVREFERDWRFHPVRKWQIDFAWLSHWVALEIEGGIWQAGRHVRGAGYVADIEKYNALTVAGWRLVRASSDMVKDGRAIALVETLLADRDRPDRAVGKERRRRGGGRVLSR